MPDDIQDLKAGFFRALGNPIRIRILAQLRKEPLAVGELQQRIGVRSSSVSQHLAVLRAHRIVVVQREGTRIIYSVEDEKLYEVLDGAGTMLERRVKEHARLLRTDVS